MAKEIEKLFTAAEELGYDLVRITTKGHPLWKHRVTNKTVLASGTPSDWRSFKNTLSKLRANAK